MSYIIRAHEAHSEGVSLSKGAKVFTVFSTSKDHGQGKGATCGCILVDFHRLLVRGREAGGRQGGGREGGLGGREGGRDAF